MIIILFDSGAGRRWIYDGPDALALPEFSGNNAANFVKNLNVLSSIADLPDFIVLADTQSSLIKLYFFNGERISAFNERREIPMVEFSGCSQNPESLRRDLKEAIQKKWDRTEERHKWREEYLSDPFQFVR